MCQRTHIQSVCLTDLLKMESDFNPLIVIQLANSLYPTYYYDFYDHHSKWHIDDILN
jgi:hypothetical protein